MNYIEVESSNIHSVGYEKPILHIVFKDKQGNAGSKYGYQPFTEEAYKDFMAAESKGKYFSANIRNNPLIECVRLS